MRSANHYILVRMDMDFFKTIATSAVTFLALYFTFQKNDKDKMNDKIDKKMDSEMHKQDIERLHNRIDKKADESAIGRIEAKLDSVIDYLLKNNK